MQKQPFDPEFTAVLEELEKKKPENKRHVEVVKLFDELLKVSKELKKNDADKENFEAIIKKLDAIASKADPKFPDSQNVVNAVNQLLSETKAQMQSLSADVRKLKLDPKISVNSPDVTVPTPEVRVDAPDLKPLFKNMEKTIGDLLAKLVKSIPEPAATDLTEVEDKLTKANDLLDEINTAVRMKPSPGSIKVTNPDGSFVGGNPLTSSRYDLQAPVYYVGTALVGTLDSDSLWTITKYDLTSNPYTGKVAQNTTWSGRTGATYV